MEEIKMKISIIAAECAPLVKVGGLGDVIGALPKALAVLGAEPAIFLPLYGTIDRKSFRVILVKQVEMIFNGRIKKFGLYRSRLPHSRIDIFLIDYKYFRPRYVYGEGPADIIRYAFFTKACLAAMRSLELKPDVIHSHDWHTALAPIFAREDDFFSRTGFLYTIHNLANQGIIDPGVIRPIFGDQVPASFAQDARDGDINLMAQGILNSDLINTVSPTYAREILTQKESAGLWKVLKMREKDLSGILNGLDAKQKIESSKSKARKKKRMLDELGWIDNGSPVAAVISRLVWQKGLDIIDDDLIRSGLRLIVLGTGEKSIEQRLELMEKKYPDQVKIFLKFDQNLADMIYAGTDIFLMPSRFEPCGLGQMIAMQNGTVPIVRATGGLSDTVFDAESSRSRANGFVFKVFSKNEFLKTAGRAVDIYLNRPDLWERIRFQGMKGDYSWIKSARKYVSLYRKVLHQARKRAFQIEDPGKNRKKRS